MKNVENNLMMVRFYQARNIMLERYPKTVKRFYFFAKTLTYRDDIRKYKRQLVERIRKLYAHKDHIKEHEILLTAHLMSKETKNFDQARMYMSAGWELLNEDSQ